jgi:hypothetical protein
MTLLKKTLLLILVTFSLQAYSQVFSIGRFSIGESRIPLNLNDFVIRTQAKKVKTNFITDSLQWIRNEDNLLVPRILLEIIIENSESNVYLLVDKKIVIPSRNGKLYSTKVYVDLFNPENIDLYFGDHLQGNIIIEARSSTSAKSKQLIDYSCSPYSLKIDGIDNEYISVGCKMNRLGKWYAQKPRLEITMSSTNLKTPSGNNPPYYFYLDSSSPLEIKLMDHDKNIKALHIEAKIPSKLNRLHTALGLGPYLYKAVKNTDSTNTLLATSLMIYGKFDLTETASFKAFDALLYSKSLFNNSGMYFSYDLAEMFDNKIYINALIGFQGIHYNYDRKSSGTEFQILYPQGFEVLYKHAFGMENYNLFYGMFLSTSQQSYTNAWIRFGKASFLELNYIKWGLNTSRIQMWGLSVGIPFFNAF